jgi:hypothetical protein
MVTWLLKIAVIVALFGLIAIDGISVALSHEEVGDAAAQAANAGAQGYGNSKNFVGALGAAEQTARDNGQILLPHDFTVAGNVVTVTLHGKASTVWLQLIPGTASLINPTETATATLDPS